MSETEGLRRRKSALSSVKELDAFPKIPDGYKETTVSGGSVSILVFVLIGILVFFEIGYYTATELKFDYEVDTDFDITLPINIDITVAMKCAWIGADILDLTGQKADSFGQLNEEDVHFQLSPEQQRHFEMVQHLNDYIREEYHAIHKFLWKTGFSGMSNSMPKREVAAEGPIDGCRLHGTLTVNKVAGNFHITAGKSVPVFPRGHAHLAMMVRETDYNFSHRINHMSFGEQTPGIISPLDAEEKATAENYHMYQYFIQVVPTKVAMKYSELETYQFAVTENNRTISHAKGSHGVPGIFFKYDLSALKVSVREEHRPYWKFLVRLCGIVGGVFATSGMLHALIGYMYDCVCCSRKWGKYSQLPTTAGSSSGKSGNTSSKKYHGNAMTSPDASRKTTSLLDNSGGDGFQTGSLLTPEVNGMNGNLLTSHVDVTLQAPGS